MWWNNVQKKQEEVRGRENEKAKETPMERGNNVQKDQEEIRGRESEKAKETPTEREKEKTNEDNKKYRNGCYVQQRAHNHFKTIEVV